MTDGLSTLYQDLLSGSYDCVDRIVLNAYFRMGHSPGGFRVWWRALTGSDETLENAYLMRLAGRFSRRVRGYAKAHNIAVIDCSVGERKHDIATEYRSKTTVVQGLFLSWLVERRRRFRMSAPNTTSTKDADPVRQPLFVSYPGPRMGSSHHQSQRASSLPGPGDLERPRVRRLPSPQGRHCLHQGGKLFY
jgi:hypothetical protein